jgi:hypothetical protein
MLLKRLSGPGSDDRVAIASALTNLCTAKETGPGWSTTAVSAHYQPISRVGEGCVRLDRIEFPNGLAGRAFWQVFIVMPNDVASAERWLDFNLSQLYEAARSVMTVTSIRAVELTHDAAAVPAVCIEGTRELSVEQPKRGPETLAQRAARLGRHAPPEPGGPIPESPPAPAP